MLREIKSPRRGVRVLYFHIDGSAVAGGTSTKNGMTIGSNDGLITENSSGNYTIAFTNPATRLLNVQVTPNTDVTTCRVVASSTTSVQIEQVGADQTTPTADGDFFVMVALQDAQDE